MIIHVVPQPIIQELKMNLATSQGWYECCSSQLHRITKIMPPLDCSSMKTYEKRYYMIFLTLWLPTKAYFDSRMSKSKMPPKSKIVAEKFGFSRLDFLVLLVSSTMQKIRLLPKCVTHADLSCRTTTLILTHSVVQVCIKNMSMACPIHQPRFDRRCSCAEHSNWTLIPSYIKN